MSIYNVLKKIYMKAYHYGLLNWIPDKYFIPFSYRVATGKKLNLVHPVTFNEKIQWIKLYDRNPLYTKLVDKFAVRGFVKERVGESFLIPLLGKWDSVDDINFELLPDRFVLKCNHDSGGLAICENKNTFNFDDAKKKLKSHLRKNHYYMSREWAYKNVKPCIIAEKYMIDDETQDLRDYKFFCFNGIPRLIQVDFNRFSDHKRNFYSLDWKLLDITIKCANDPTANLKKPVNLNEMIEVAKRLSVGISEVRVDLYSVNGRTFFGELTLYHGGGIEKFSSEQFAEKMGSWINLELAHKGGKTL